MTRKQSQNFIDHLIGQNFKIWSLFNFVAIWFFAIAILYFNVSPLFGTVSITNLFFVMETYTFVPLFFDLILFLYILELVHLFFNKNRLSKISAKYFTYNYLRSITYIVIFFSLAIAFFIPVYNPLSYFNGWQNGDQIFSSLTLTCFVFFGLILLLINRKRSFTTIIFWFNCSFYILSLLTLISLFVSNNDLFQSAYMIPLIIILSLQIKIYDYSRSIMNTEEFFGFVTNHTVPSRILIKAKVFDSEDEYQDAQAKGAKNKDQLYLINKYQAKSYKSMIETRDHNFPSYPMYQDALNHGIHFYREWKKYSENFERIGEITSDYSAKKKSLASLLKKTNRIMLDQIMQFIGSKNVKPVLYWFAKLPDSFPLSLDGDMIVINSTLTEEQINYIVNSLFATLD